MKCDCCNIENGYNRLKVYKVSDEVKEYTGLKEYGHLCKFCYDDLNEDKDLCIVNNSIKLKETHKKQA